MKIGIGQRKTSYLKNLRQLMYKISIDVFIIINKIFIHTHLVRKYILVKYIHMNNKCMSLVSKEITVYKNIELIEFQIQNI